jgi:hypothetical protein
MPNYEDPNNKMEEAYNDVRALDCHRDRLAEVTIAVLAAYATRDKDDEPRVEALSRRGRPILGKIRITTLEDRASGATDLRVILNGDRWGQLSAAMQRSVIDDCLTGVEVIIDGGRPKLDDHGRPKLRTRAYDYDLCGFHEVAERNGSSSVEVNNFRVLFNEHGQIYLPHIDPGNHPTNVLSLAPKRTRTMAKAISVGGTSSHARGKLGTKALRIHIDLIDKSETLLALAKIEHQKSPRKDVITAIKERVMSLLCLPDYIAVTKGQDTSVNLDLDAAALMTMKAPIDTDTLDRLVPGCADAVVLGWLLEDERAQATPREEVIEVIEGRVAEVIEGRVAEVIGG